MDFLDQLHKGYNLLQLKKPKQARQIFEKVIAAKPDFSMSYTLMAYSYLYESNFRDTYKFAQQALELEPNNPENHYLKGIALQGLNDADGAIKNLERAIELDSNNDIYYLQLAKSYAKKEIIGKAFTFAEKAIELNPNNPDAYAFLSYLEEKYKDKKGASDKYLQKGLQIDPHNQMLKELQINKAVSQADTETSITLSEQLLSEDPSEYAYRQKVLDSHLSQFPLYRSLVLKYRSFNEVNYISIIFSLAFVLFTGLLLRPKNINEPYFNFLRIIGAGIAIWTFLFWSVRSLGQAYMKRKLWSFKLKQILDTELLVHANMILAMLSFIAFTITIQAIWFGTAFFLCILSLWSLPLIIPDENKLSFYYKIYLSVVYLLAGLLFYLSWVDSEHYGQISNWFAAVLFIPTLGSLLLISIVDSFKNRKNNSPSTAEIKEEPEETVNMSCLEKLLNLSVLVLFFILQFIGPIIGANIFDTTKFMIIWGLIGISLLIGTYLFLKKIDSPTINLISNTRSVEHLTANLMARGISILLVVFIFAIVTTAYFPYGKETWHQLQIEEHGLEMEDRKRYVILRKDNGWKVKLKPSRNALYESEFKSCLRVKVKKSFLGVGYATEFEQCPEEKTEE